MGLNPFDESSMIAGKQAMNDYKRVLYDKNGRL
jgi:hypothetical protein